MTELKPCPFCSGAAMLFHRFSTKANVIPWVQVECTNQRCGANGPRIAMVGEMPGDDQRYAAQAIAAWNTRASEKE